MGRITGTTHQRLDRRAFAAIAVAGALAITACGGGDDADTSSVEEVGDMAAEEPMEVSAESGGLTRSEDPGYLATSDNAAPESGDAPTEGGFDIGVIGRDVIIEMRVVLSSDDIQRTVASVTAAASTLGGGIASSDVNFGSGEDNEGFAVLVVKVPPSAVDRLLAGLDDSGVVLSINQSAQDVTDQLVDLDVRLANARTSVDNVREFMDRTENLNELVSLEAELTRRQTDLERLEAQKRNIADRVALSTITIEVIPTASVQELVVEEDESIGDAFRSGWDAFAAFVFGIGFVIAATLPFLVLGLVIAVALWVWVRRRDDRSKPVAAPLPAPAGGRSDDDASATAGPDADEQADDREPEPVH